MSGTVAATTRWPSLSRPSWMPRRADAPAVIGRSVRGCVVVGSVLDFTPLMARRPHPGEDAEHEDDQSGQGKERVGQLLR